MSVRAAVVQRWDRQEGETPKAYAAFRNYLEQEPTKRTYVEAARRTYGPKGVQRTGAVVGIIREWLERHRWEERARAYDNHMNAVRQAADEKATLDMARRHATESEFLQRALLAPAMALANRLASDPQAIGMFAGTDVEDLVRLAERAARAYDTMARFERAVRGVQDPAQRVEAEVTVPPAEAVAKRLDELAARRAARGDAEEAV